MAVLILAWPLCCWLAALYQGLEQLCLECHAMQLARPQYTLLCACAVAETEYGRLAWRAGLCFFVVASVLRR